MNVRNLHIYEIIRPANPHRAAWDEDAMRELTDSIRQLGILEPIIVRTIDGGYQVIAGDRRLEAAKRARLPTIPAIIRDDADLLHGEAITWAENLNREELAPMDQARQVERMHTTGGLATDRIATITGRTETWVTTRLDMMTLPRDVRAQLEEQRIAIGAALALGRVTDTKHREYLTTYTINSGASVPVVREWVNEWERVASMGTPTTDALPPMPINGEPYIVLVPCWLCHQPIDHNHMLIQRVCRPCAIKMQTAINEADAEPSPPPDQEQSTARDLGLADGRDDEPITIKRIDDAIDAEQTALRAGLTTPEEATKCIQRLQTHRTTL